MIVERPGQIHYELVWGNKSIIVHDAFFGQTYVGETYLHINRIPTSCYETNSPGLDRIIALYGKDNVSISDDRIECSVDLFAGAFFMLTRWEESFGLNEDIHGRFPAVESIVVKSGFILRPIVDEYVALLKKWLLQIGYPVQESKSQFQVVPSCDVDMPYYWLRSPRWKLWINEWRKHSSWDHLLHVRKRIKAVQSEEEEDLMVCLIVFSEQDLQLIVRPRS